jgi:hypothetical protein
MRIACFGTKIHGDFNVPDQFFAMPYAMCLLLNHSCCSQAATSCGTIFSERMRIAVRPLAHREMVTQRKRDLWQA